MPLRSILYLVILLASTPYLSGKLMRRILPYKTSTLETACRQSKYGGMDCKAMSSIAYKFAESFKTSDKQGSDDIWLNLVTGIASDAEGDALRVEFEDINGRKDTDSLGFVGEGSERAFFEDVDATLNVVRLYAERPNDICIRMFVLTVDKEVSGYDRRKSIILPAWTISDITKTEFSAGCVYFGRGYRALGRLWFKWREAVECFDQHFGKTSNDYAICLARRSITQFTRKSTDGFVQFSNTLW